VWLGGLIPGWWAGRKGWPRLPDSSKKSEAARRVLRAKEDRELFALLLPYMGRDPEIDKALKDLEANLYGGARNRVDRRRVAEAVARLEWGEGKETL
ncbi:MAG: hypothetical protein GXO33_04040, partial [Epsilonproteobacteria bacterium]|nr:hypothetical protein [Campylobacterota bacterium]